ETIPQPRLEKDRPATPAVLAMLDSAQTSFRVWVDTLRRKGQVTPDPKTLRAAIAKVEMELPDDDPAPASVLEIPAQPSNPPSALPIEVRALDETPAFVADASEVPIATAEIIEFSPVHAPVPETSEAPAA